MPKGWNLKYEDLPESLKDRLITKELPTAHQSHSIVELVCDCGKVYKTELRYIINGSGELKSDLICSSCSRSRYQKDYNLNNPDIVLKRIKSVKRYYEKNPEARNLISDRVKQDHINDPSRGKKLVEWVKNNPDAMTYCNHSSFENEIREFINSLLLNTKVDRTILNGKEIDILIPDKHVGIECNGLYWHSSWKVNNIYHYNKFIDCKNKGIHLIQITDYDWYTNQNKIKIYLQDLLNDNKLKLYARNLSVRFLQPKLAKDFYNRYHLQGCNLNLGINYGLYLNDELISCMSFGKSRVRNRNNSEGFYELHRYCVKEGYTVIGGAERLFKSFINDYEPLEIKTFSDNDYFTGGIYTRLGFIEQDYVRVYFWWNHKNVCNRESCQLKYLKERFPSTYNKALILKESGEVSNLETYIMEEEGYQQYYTSGRTKWVWKSDKHLNG